MSVAGRRQTRRRRRARRRRAQRKKFANVVLLELIAGVHALTGEIAWGLLFFGLMLSMTMAVATVLLGEVPFAVFFVLSTLFLCLALWTREFE